MLRPAPQPDWRGDISDMLPERAARAVAGMNAALAAVAIELRLGAERPMLALDCHRDYYISPEGHIAALPSGALTLNDDECRQFVDMVTKYSAYAYADELRNGFLTLKGGYRVGIAGKTTLAAGSVAGFGVCTSFCVRIPHEVVGIGDELGKRIRCGGGIRNTLIVSPPGMGKTTLLRDLARALGSDGPGRPGLRLCVVDERSEISGGLGARRFNLGTKTDVLDGCPKSQGITLALRSLNPQVILTDEIGRAEDAAALQDALNCGVGIVATAHGGGLEDLLCRPVLRGMIGDGLFEWIVVIGGARGIGGVTEIFCGTRAAQWRAGS